MQDLYFDSSTHSYYYKGEKKPCVSDVLKMVDVIALEGIPQRNLETAAEGGTRVHEQTELLEVGLADRNDEDWRDENYDILGYIDAYENFLIEHEELPIALEESVYSEEYDLAGTIDIVKYIDGNLAIIDKKTSKTISKLRSELQLNIYRLLWNSTHPDMQVKELYILQLQEDSGNRFIPIEVREDLAIRYINQFKEIKGDFKL